MRTGNRFVAAALMALVAGACATETGTRNDTTSTSQPVPTTVDSVPATPPPSTTSTMPPGTTSTTLPGEPIDFGPVAGDTLMVIGVAHDDLVNLRAAPGPTMPILATIEPTARNLTALGETRQLPRALWIKVNHGGTIGWVHMSFIAYEGATDDVTSQVVDNLGRIPTAPSMTELGLIIAKTMMSTDPVSDIVVVVFESVGDLGEVTYDVIGLADDSVRGVRLHVFGDPVGNGFSLKAVESTVLCGRGVTDEGLCI